MTVETISHATFELPAARLRTRRAFRVSPVTAAAALVALIALLPLGFIVWVTIAIGWEASAALIFRGRVGELLVNTLLLEALTVPIAIVLTVALAWLTERSDLPGARWWAWLMVAPLAVPAFVHSYAWVSAIPTFNGLFAAVLVSVLAYSPFLYLPVAAQMRRIDPALEDTAASLGDSPWRVFYRVVLPQLRIAICGGALLVGLHLLAEYGLYVMIRYDTFTTAIVDQFQSTFNGAAAHMLAGVLVICCLGLLVLENLLRGQGRYARLGSGAPRPAASIRLGRATLPVLIGLALLVSLSLGVPLVTLTRWLLASGLKAWADEALIAAITQTALYAVVGGVLTVAAALPMAWLSIRAPSRFQRFLEACHYYLGALPGVVVALALVTIAVRVALPLYQTIFTLLLAYALMFLPRALVGLRASLAQTSPALEEAAVTLGRPPLLSVMQVTLRLAAPGVAASMALVAMGITTELTATLMLSPNGTSTLATEFWALTSELDYGAAAPYAVLMIVFSLPLTLILHAQSRRWGGR
jgi:iron(III) transport system permease protein